MWLWGLYPSSLTLYLCLFQLVGMWTFLSSVWPWELFTVLLLGIFSPGLWTLTLLMYNVTQPYSWRYLLLIPRALSLCSRFLSSPRPISSGCFGLLKTLISVSLTWHDCQAPLVPPACAVALKPPLGSKQGQFQSLVHLLFLQGTQSCAVYCPLFENCYFMYFVWFPRKSLIVAGEHTWVEGEAKFPKLNELNSFYFCQYSRVPALLWKFVTGNYLLSFLICLE